MRAGLQGCVHARLRACACTRVPVHALGVCVGLRVLREAGSQLQAQGGLSRGRWPLGSVKHPDCRKRAKWDPRDLCLGVRPVQLTPRREAERGAEVPSASAI